MKNITFFLFALNFFLNPFAIICQSFEGEISYKIEMQNPFPEQITAEQWAEQVKTTFGEKGYMLQKYYYKKGNYSSEIEAGNEVGFQTYSPTDGLLYSWQKGSDAAVTLDSKKFMDKFESFIESDETETIMGIPCRVITIKSTVGEMKIWYNSDYFKADPADYQGHVYGHFEKMLEKIGCLPIKVDQKGLSGHIIMTIIEYKEEEVDDSRFSIPDFKEVSANPMN